VVVAGGVSASPALRKMMHERLPIKPFFPDIRLCTDNGAMVAVSGYYQAVHGKQADPKTLDIVPNLSM
jgi:N6-L-threonylcarbamoyladenine synthase